MRNALLMQAEIYRGEKMDYKKLHWASLPIFLGPVFVIYCLFVIYPSIDILRMSVFEWRGLSAARNFIGLTNFYRILLDANFMNSLLNSLVVMGVSLLISLILALFFSEFLSQNISGKKFYQNLYLLPNVFGDVVIAVLWMIIFNPRIGALNSILEIIGLSVLTRAWLGEPRTALLAVTVPVIWKWLGFYVILFYGSIRNIPKEIYEAADVDGVNKFQRFFFITLPSLKNTLQVAAVFMLVQSFNVVFAFVQIMTDGGPRGSTEVIQTYLYKQAFDYGNFGYASSIGVVTIIGLLIISISTYKIFKKIF